MAWIDMDKTESAVNAVAILHNSTAYTLVGIGGFLFCSLESCSECPLQLMGRINESGLLQQ